MYMYMRQLIFSRKSDCLGCAVLLCLVCLFDLLTLLASFFLPSHLSFKNMYIHVQRVQVVFGSGDTLCATVFNG